MSGCRVRGMKVPFGLVGLNNGPLVINGLWGVATFKGIIW